MNSPVNLSVADRWALTRLLVTFVSTEIGHCSNEDLDTLQSAGLVHLEAPGILRPTDLGKWVLATWFGNQESAPSPTSTQSEVAYTQAELEYPSSLIHGLISGNSPYAFYLFQWVPYQTEAKRWRLKMFHDAKTFDGREVSSVWPNGSSFGPFKDEEVEFIRISKNQLIATWIDPRK